MNLSMMVLYSLIQWCYAQLMNCDFKDIDGKLSLKDCRLKINKTRTFGEDIETGDILISNSIIYSDKDQNISANLEITVKVLVMINSTINIQSLVISVSELNMENVTLY
jgi:hypothetical protein